MSFENMENEKAYTKWKNYIFKTIAISKIVFQALVTSIAPITVPKHIVHEL